MESLKEITQFLDENARLDLKAVAVSHILSLTGTPEGRKLLYECPVILLALAKLTGSSAETVAKESLLCLVNLSAENEGANAIFREVPNIIQLCVENILNENCFLADAWTMLLSNLSRSEDIVENVYENLEKHIIQLVKAFVNIDYNKKKCHLNYLAPIFSNLSQTERGRDHLCDIKLEILPRLLPFIHYEDSVIRKGGIVGLLKNICFDFSRHNYLLEEINILPIILLPLAGPEEYPDDEIEKLPIELQYLGPDKNREADPDIRKMLLDSLAQLCATRKAREVLRSQGTYEVLRELHKWESLEEGDKSALLSCENVVDILIRTEDEIGESNLKTIDIPQDLLTKFNEMDKNLVDDTE